MKTFEIYFNDLIPDVRDLLLKQAGVESAEDMNWDVFPIATIDFEEEEE